LTARGDDEQALTDDSIALARQYGRYGYCRVTAFLFTTIVENKCRSDQILKRASNGFEDR
jgi:hypothetical protein